MPAPKETVLVVDDEAPVLGFLAEFLEQRGYRVIAAASGPEALEKIAGRERNIDLLLTDLIMPGMTGRSLADTLLSWCPGLDVIFMSGYVDDTRTLPDGPQLHYIHKPFSPQKLDEVFRDVLRKRRKKKRASTQECRTGPQR